MAESDLRDLLDFPETSRPPEYSYREGDAGDLPLSDATVDFVVTSPPYWQKRDYGHSKQIGQESAVEGYVESIRECLSEWSRVLTETGSIILNIGDKYKNKSRLGIPWKVAQAAREEGFRVRSEIVWHKPNGVPTPAKDRFTDRHEHLFHFTPKNRDYYFDKFGFGLVYEDPVDVWTVSHDSNESHLAPFPEELVERALIAACPPSVCTDCAEPERRIVEKGTTELNPDRPQARRAMEKFENSELTEEHIRAIQATGISDAGKGKEIQNKTGQNKEKTVELAEEAKDVLGGYFREFTFPVEVSKGWDGCDCNEDTRPGVVLDPFAGSGTTLEVAKRLGMSAVGVDINPPSEEEQERLLSREESQSKSVSSS